jgi:hypothetical protein
MDRVAIAVLVTVVGVLVVIAGTNNDRGALASFGWFVVMGGVIGVIVTLARLRWPVRR